eukprot:7273918-Prymnesium_polylepis.1
MCIRDSYVIRCTEKCRQYTCATGLACASEAEVGVQVLGAHELTRPGAIGHVDRSAVHRTGQPLDGHQGERRGRRPVPSREPTAETIRWRYSGCAEPEGRRRPSTNGIVYRRLTTV